MYRNSHLSATKSVKNICTLILFMLSYIYSCFMQKLNIIYTIHFKYIYKALCGTSIIVENMN